MNSNHSLINNYNYFQVPVKVIYCIREKIIGEKQFFLNSTFYTILHYFNKNLKEEGKTKLKREYMYNGQTINPNEPLINLIELKKNSSSSTIESVEILIEIEETNKEDDDYIPYFDIIIQPKINPFGLFVYKIKEGIINVQVYPEKISKKYELSKYSDFSSYCNSPKSLFISGGKFKNLPIKDFWIIDNHKYSIIKEKMPIEKFNHSMIYVTISDNEYIFIVGGNNLNTFYYDIKNNSFENWGDTNSNLIKPALFQYKNYLYCFNSFRDDDNYYFERTNLESQEHIWEKIFPLFDNDTFDFKTESFGVSSCTNGNILLVGGINIKPRTLIYDPKNNSLSLSKTGKNEKIILSDKYFYKVNKLHYVALPTTLKSKKEIAIVNKIKQNIRLINFTVSDGISKVKFNQDDYGKIIVKAKIHERLRFEMQPKIVTAQNLTISNNEPIFNEKEILNVEIKPNINEENIDTGKRKIMKKSNKIFLPSSMIYNNLIDLIVKNNNKNNKNIKNIKNINLYQNYKNFGIVEMPKGDQDSLHLINFSSSSIKKEEDIKNNKKKENIKNLNNNKFIISKNIDINLNINLDNKTNNNDNDEEEYEDERVIRDAFETTIREKLEEDIIEIEEYFENYYDINNFADYQIP